MSPFTLLATLCTLAALFGFINYRFLRLPSAIGLMIVSLAASLVMVGVDRLLPALDLGGQAAALLKSGHLPENFLNGALSLLMFSGSLEVDPAALWKRKFTIALLATVGVLLATGLFGFGIWLIFGWTGEAVPLLSCMVLGAMLAPTDPVSLAQVLRRVALPPSLRAVIAGESLFNDGAAIVAFVLLLGAAGGSDSISAGMVALDILREVLGGLLLGAATGWVAIELMRRIDDYPLEIMISLALALGTYSLAGLLGASGPIAVATAGLMIGDRGRRLAMSETTRTNLVLFWRVLDQLLNALLFLLLGFVVLSLAFDLPAVLAALGAIPLALAVRGVSVVVPVYWLHWRNPNRWRGAAVLTWGGVRGGISVALALTLPQAPGVERIQFVCYAVVVFTILVQGLTVRPLSMRLYRE